MWHIASVASVAAVAFLSGSHTLADDFDSFGSVRRSLTGALETIASERNFRECGEVIDTVYPGEFPPILNPNEPVNELNYGINAVIQFLGAFFSPPINGADPLRYDDFYGIFLDAVGRKSSDLYSAQYGIKVVKVCGSCGDYRLKNEAYRAAYNEYCGKNIYGRDATFSGVALVPIESDGTMVEGALKGAVSSTSIQTDGYQTVSVQWPPPEVGGVGAMIADLGLYINYIPAMMAAGTGRFVGLIVDNMGYGESTDCFKSAFVRKSYQTSVVPLWLSTQDLIAKTSNCDTELVSKVVVSGASEGGYGALAVAEALNSVGVEIIMVQAGMPADLDSSISLNVDNILTSSLGARFSYTFVMIGSSFSSSRPDLPNYMIPGQGLFEDTARPRYVNWAQANLEIPDLRLLISTDFGIGGNESLKTDGVNPAVLSSVEEDGNLCEDPSGLEDLCAALSENEILDTLPTIQYPVEICHSPFDDLIPFNGEEYANATAVNSDVSLKPTLDTWMRIASPQTLTNIYIHASAVPSCLVMQGWTAVDDMTAAKMSGKCKFGGKKSTAASKYRKRKGGKHRKSEGKTKRKSKGKNGK